MGLRSAFFVIVAGTLAYYLIVDRVSFGLVVVGCFGSFFVAPIATASARNVSLQYSAAPGCPERSEFEAALSTRGAALESSEVRALDVLIDAKDAGFSGTLRVESENQSSSTREVHANDCAEVVKGLAVVAAIALGASEKKVNNEGGEVTPAQTDSPPSAPAPSPPPEKKPDEGPRRLRGNSFKRESEIQVKEGTLHVDRRMDLTLRAGANFSLIPGLVMPRYELTNRVTHFITPPGDSSRLIGPTVEVSVSMLNPMWRDAGELRTQVFGFGAEVRACSALTYDSEGFSALFCSGFGLTGLQFDTKNSDGKVTQSKFTGIGVAGVGLGVQYNIGRFFHVGARVGGQVQVGGASAERPDGSTLFKVPLFGGDASAGLGVSF